MGRWLKKAGRMPEPILTKPTQPSSVSFVSTHSEPFYQNNLSNSGLVKFITKCCKGFNVDPQQVIGNLLNYEDELDIKNGNISADILRLHIEC